MSTISGYRLDAVHAFRVRTLAQLGYRTRVALGNASQARPEWASAYRVDVSVTGPSRRREVVIEGVAVVQPGERRMLDCDDFVRGFAHDVEVVFHLVPETLIPLAVDGTVSLSREQLFYYLTIQDHYVEYHREDGYSAGILYQSGAFNYALFSKERSTLIQAPKCYVSTEVDTLVSLVNSSADPDYDVSAVLRCALVAPGGAGEIAWTETLSPFGVSLVSLRDRVRAAGHALGPAPRFYCFHAVSDNATLLPIAIQRNDRTSAIGLEHSLPPIYYAEEARGALRARAIRGFDERRRP